MPKTKTITKKKTTAKEKLTKEKVKETTASKGQKKKETLKKPGQKEGQVKKEKKIKYFEAVGRRKTATARVRLYTQGEKRITVNEKPYNEYFVIPFLQKILEAPMEKLKCQEKFGISIKVRGGGLTGQAEACRHGIARAFVLLNPYFKKRLKKLGFLTRDSRMRERKKPGLKRARRAPQWSKR